ncbi:hypothetical protein ACFW7J_00680 [Streptomyces sp. NPDC059525]|uniref:hypothetical protein n=1 Tax=Streptomyces sp. NPDC059525 TaxID=3346857 RepID=UPI003673AEB9
MRSVVGLLEQHDRPLARRRGAGPGRRRRRLRRLRLVQHGRGTAHRPRNLSIATLGKPDIRFTSALDNEIEVAQRDAKVLVYDHPVGKEGLLWRHLLAWWQETRNITDH